MWRGLSSLKQWVPEQGEICRYLLLRLLASTSEVPDVFFITPFRQVKTELRSLLSAALNSSEQGIQALPRIRSRIGTVHTFQGKEADYVFLVLGCDSTKGGAADWAGQKPNLLNVAVTRARRALYVIGDINVWQNRGYFSDLQNALPVKVYNPGSERFEEVKKQNELF